MDKKKSKAIFGILYLFDINLNCYWSKTIVSLHFQIEKKVLLDNGTHVESVEIKFGLINTKLRSNPAYVHGYSLIGSTIIMVVIPGMYGCNQRVCREETQCVY